MELSKRLLAVASLVTTGSIVADIGTDHAYIPLYLIQEKKAPGAIAMDVNEGPLLRAEEHVRDAGLTEQIRLRRSDGLEQLSPGECDCAVIAGMGGGLMIRILSAHPEITKSLKECILQPQSEIERVRSFLLEEGFVFLQEDMVLDDGKYYMMMKVRHLFIVRFPVYLRWQGRKISILPVRIVGFRRIWIKNIRFTKKCLNVFMGKKRRNLISAGWEKRSFKIRPLLIMYGFH